MPDTPEELLERISHARPSNEAEVETKILLHLFRLLGYTEADRADKPSIPMYFGHERRVKTPDFILYDGRERTHATALVAVEAKAPGINLQDSVSQIVSYAAWVGTPFLLMCNGDTLMISKLTSSSNQYDWRDFTTESLRTSLPAIQDLIGKSATVFFKERSIYLFDHLPKIGGALPPEAFLLEYSAKFEQRFQAFALSSPLEPPQDGPPPLPEIPVNIRWVSNLPRMSDSVSGIAKDLLTAPKRLFISGKPGSGKSTFSRRLAFALATEPTPQGTHKLPIFVNLALGLPSSREDALRRSCREMGVRYFPALFRRTIEESHCVLILDGLDETHENSPALTATLKSLISDCAHASVVITGRPYALESVTELISSNRFQVAEILDLTEDEVWQVLERYISDSGKLGVFRRSVSEGRIALMRSPLLALMAARVVNEMPDWEGLTLLDLYGNYIRILHRYFNAPTVRGSAPGPNAVIHDEMILAVNAEAACLVRRQSLSFNELRQMLVERYREEAVTAWVNCGLATSREGRVHFVHESFLDYGIAYNFLHGIRTRGVEALGDSTISQGAYDLIGPALTVEDESVLSEGIRGSSNRIRRRAASLLRHRASEATLDYISGAIFVEESRKIFQRMVVVLLNHRPSALDEVWSKLDQLHRNLRRKLRRMMRETASLSAYQHVLKMATLGSANYIRIAFGLAANRQDYTALERLADLYSKLRGPARGAVCAELSLAPLEYRTALVPHLLRVEKSLNRKLHLIELVLRESEVFPFTPDLIDDIQSAILKESNLSRKMIVRLHFVLKWIDKTASPSEALIQLADVIRIRLGSIKSES